MNICSFVSDNAILSKETNIGNGVLVNQGAIIDNFVEINDEVVVNIGASVSHHSKIGKDSFLAPKYTIAGHVEVGESVFIGANATIINNIKIGNNSIIAAGSVITNDVSENVMGSSNGIGYSICEKLLKEGNVVIGFSRSSNSKLFDIAELHNAKYKFYQVDLSQTIDAVRVFKDLLDELNEKITHVCMINNAATIDPIKMIGEWDCDEISYAVSLNIHTSIMFINEFVKFTRDKAYEKVIINISSGMAQKSIKGWAMYGISKALLDRITISVAHEQLEQKNPIKIFSFYPGKVDTNMQ
ncbi:SDR family NAD(P)-dependent oxidoreductase [Metabacillus fastidiosus]|uniref:SDR family NAD(P)-dependent oxidoreductase n=1 Tax=Metabacillus fastidiosus TaxID=1458 RepID=UPI002E2384AC|nr:SDR family NAD(P)-dependent oxidoreductase [Metabacillus fastidiosus]